MLKKITFAVLLFTFVFINSSYAAQPVQNTVHNGYILNKSGTWGHVQSTNIPSTLTDGDFAQNISVTGSRVYTVTFKSDAFFVPTRYRLVRSDQQVSNASRATIRLFTNAVDTTAKYTFSLSTTALDGKNFDINFVPQSYSHRIQKIEIIFDENMNLAEFDIYGERYVYAIGYGYRFSYGNKAISDTAVQLGITDGTLYYRTDGSHYGYRGYDLVVKDMDGNVVDAHYNPDTKVVSNLKPDTKYKVDVTTHFINGLKDLDSTTITTLPPDTTPPSEVTNAKHAIKNDKDVQLTYTLPTDKDFSHVLIYRDGKELKNNGKETTFLDTSTTYNSTANYKIVTVDLSGNKSSGVTLTVKIPQKAAKDVTNLNYSATAADVTLSWTNSTHHKFNHITIYRKAKADNKLRALFNSGEYTKLTTLTTETYKDTAVAANTSYTYKVTTTIDGKESDGVTIDVRTKSVVITGADIVKKDNGDYTVSWTAPVSGKIQIDIAGTKYKVVAAANKSYTIPAADVKVNAVTGAPDVSLTPLSDADVVVGSTVKLGGLNSIGGNGKLFNADELLQAAVSLLSIVGAFILLGLAFRVVPMLVKTIRNAFISGGAKR